LFTLVFTKEGNAQMTPSVAQDTLCRACSR
jgi:hypothetical protein